MEWPARAANVIIGAAIALTGSAREQVAAYGVETRLNAFLTPRAVQRRVEMFYVVV
jgi:hypothetical protein